MVIFLFKKKHETKQAYLKLIYREEFFLQKKTRIEDENKKINEWVVTLHFNLNTPFFITRIRFIAENFDAHLLPMLFFTFSDKKRLGDFVYLKINMESHIFKQELYTVVYHSQIKIT